jgi:hypothetical protein
VPYLIFVDAFDCSCDSILDIMHFGNFKVGFYYMSD